MKIIIDISNLLLYSISSYTNILRIFQALNFSTGKNKQPTKFIILISFFKILRKITPNQCRKIFKTIYKSKNVSNFIILFDNIHIYDPFVYARTNSKK